MARLIDANLRAGFDRQHPSMNASQEASGWGDLHVRELGQRAGAHSARK